MGRDDAQRSLDAHWLDSLRNGYTDVFPVIRDRRSFDAEWADGHWVHDPHPEMWQEATLAPPVSQPPVRAGRQLSEPRPDTAPLPVAAPGAMPSSPMPSGPFGLPLRDPAPAAGRTFSSSCSGSAWRPLSSCGG